MSASLNWAEFIKTKLADKLIQFRESAPGEAEFIVGPDVGRELLRTLKNLEGGPFDHLADLTAYDEYPQTPRFHVVYELISMVRKQRASVIVQIPTTQIHPTVPTIVDLWAGANWLEREVYDMYGIVFDGHPDPRRILLPEAFKGHPLKKDFAVDFRQQFPEPISEEGLFDPFGNTIVTKEGDG